MTKLLKLSNHFKWLILYERPVTVLHFRPVGKISPRKPSQRLNSKINFTTTNLYILMYITSVPRIFNRMIYFMESFRLI